MDFWGRILSAGKDPFLALVRFDVGQICEGLIAQGCVEVSADSSRAYAIIGPPSSDWVTAAFIGLFTPTVAATVPTGTPILTLTLVRNA